MRRVRTSIIASLLMITLLTGFVACRQQPPQQTDLFEAQVRQLATKYRDEWVNKSALPERAILARGTIRSVEKLFGGWHIVFVTATGHDPDTPEGLHDYYLHVYLKISGELERIERGPDVVSWTMPPHTALEPTRLVRRFSEAVSKDSRGGSHAAATLRHAQRNGGKGGANIRSWKSRKYCDESEGETKSILKTKWRSIRQMFITKRRAK